MSANQIEYKTIRIHKADWKKLKNAAMEKETTVLELISQMAADL